MQEKIIIPDHTKDCIIVHLQGDPSMEQEASFREWVGSNEFNLRFFEQLEVIWKVASKSSPQQFDMEKAWKDVERLINHSAKVQEHKYNLYRKLKPVLKVAAMLVFAYILGIATVRWTSMSPVDSDQYVEMTAPKGSRAFLTLDDGTKVWLNAGTSLKYPKNYGQHIRNVSLDGEAYFEVAKNKDIPFVVNVNGVNIKALGTAFNVKAYAEDGQVETTLTEGLVQIEQADVAMQPIILQPNQKVVLKAGIVQSTTEKVEVIAVKPVREIKPAVTTKNDKVADIMELSDTRPYTSWKDPRWVFKQQNMAELATKLERRYDVNFVFEDEHLKDYVISGTLLDETLEQVMNTLQLTAPIDYTIDHKTVILKENSKLKEKYQQLIK